MLLCHLILLFPLLGLLLFAFLPVWTALVVYVPLAALSLAIGIPTVRTMYSRS